MPLTIPGSSTGQLVSSAAPAANSGISLLEPRFLSLLQQNDVSEENMAKLGTAGCKTMALFGHIGGKDEARLEAYLKAVLNLDSQARPEDFIPIAQLVIVWTACKKRAEVETEVQAQRVVNHLPPQLTAEDHAAARDALEHRLKRPVPDHIIPSENYFQRKVGEVEGKFNPDKLTEVTNVTQEEAQKKPKGQAASTNYLDFDDTGRPTGLKSKTTDFWVPMPHNEATFKNRFEVMDHLYTMLQMRFSSNPILATYEVGMFKEYCEDYLCGERVWAFVIRGDNNEPISSPSLRQVCNYDFQLRGLMTRLMRKKVDIKTALERAMNDQDTRTLYFTAGFTMESNTAECKALSAPCLEEMFTSLAGRRGSKRELGADGPTSSAPAVGKTAAQLKKAEKNKNKRAKKAANQKAILDQQKASGAAPPAALAIMDIQKKSKGAKGGGKNGKATKGGGKAAKNAGKPAVPAGVVPPGAHRTDPTDGKPLCYAFSRKEKCVQEPCNFKHVCWWCLDATHAGNDCPN